MIDGAAHYRENQARQRVNALKTDVPLKRYVDGMARRREILPGSEQVIIDAVTRPAPMNHPRNSLAHLGVPAPERPAPLPGGNGHADLIARCVAYLDGPGACYLNPAHQPDPNELPMVAIARRLGVPKDSAERFYLDNAVALAGRTGASLAVGVFHRLTAVADGRYLGVEPPAARPEPQPAPEPTPPPVATGGLMIAGVYHPFPATPAPDAKPEPATAGSQYLAGVRGGF